MRTRNSHLATLDQEGLFVLQKRAPTSSAYNESVGLRVRGRFDLDAARAAVNSVVAAHGSLRSTFAARDGSVHQEVADHLLVDMPLAEIEPGDVPGWMREHVKPPFDLEAGPLVRAGACRTAADEHVLIFVAHHIVCDGWSRSIFLRDFERSYVRFEREGSGELPTPSYEYSDYARAQRQLLDMARRSDLEEYWRDRLRDYGWRGLGVQGYRSPAAGAVRTTAFGNEDTRALVAFCRERAITPFVFCLAAMQSVLVRKTGERDLVIGTDFANRPESRLEPLIGFFAKQLPLRFRIGSGASFADLLDDTRRVVLDAVAHSQLSYPEILRLSGKPADGPPLISVKLVLEQDLTPPIALPGATAMPILPDIVDAKFDLLLNVALNGGALFCRAEFDPARVSPHVADAVLADFETLAIRGAAEPRHAPEALDQAGEVLNPFVAAGAGSPRRFQRRAISIRGLSRLIAEADPAIPAPLPSFRLENPDADGLAAIQANAETIRAHLAETGAVLLRGLPAWKPQQFRDAAECVFGSLMLYGERTSPRTRVEERVYTSTDYSAEHSIPLHNENSYASSWPRWMAFFCSSAALRGGCTPLARTDAVLEALPDRVRARFEDRQLLYVRRFGGPLGLSTADAFGTSERAELEATLLDKGYEWTFADDGRLRTRRRAPALRPHPGRGELVWFNHAHFVCAASQDAGDRYIAADERPLEVRFGDGGPIPSDDAEALGRAYLQASFRFPWTSGDLLLVDNMLFAHGRDPFEGRRTIWVAMAEEISGIS